MLHDLNTWKLSKRWGIIFTVVMFVGGISLIEFWKSYKKKLLLSKRRKDKQKAKIRHKGIATSPNDKIQYAVNHAGGDFYSIINMNTQELINFLKANENGYETVFNIYQRQALLQDQRLNCVVEFVKLDISCVNLSGPFYGMPISLKDNLILKGYESYVGCSSFLNKPKATESCVLVRVLQKLGAIPFVKTTVPQTMMTILASNPIDGIFKNPQNRNFISGGSSSGEAALIGAKGSILGFGSDIAGSVRIPAAFCGVVGLKPTIGRISSKDVFKLGIPTLVKSVIGPICPNVETCAFALKCIVDSEEMSKLDPEIPYLPFNEENYNKKKLKIGYFYHDDSYYVVPAMQRAVEESVKKLKEKGHEVVQWKPPLCGKDWWRLYLRSISIDGGQKLKAIIKNDQIDNSIINGVVHVDQNILSYVYNFFKYKLPDWVVDPDMKLFHQCSIETLNSSDCMALLMEIESFRINVINEWSKCGLDVVICPAGGFTALPLKANCLYSPLLSYIFIWNLVNFPAGTVPVTKVKPNDIKTLQSEPKYKSTPTQKNILMLQKDTEKLPVSVQCVSLPWKEELCLNLMRELEKIAAESGEIVEKIVAVSGEIVEKTVGVSGDIVAESGEMVANDVS